MAISRSCVFDFLLKFSSSEVRVLMSVKNEYFITTVSFSLFSSPFRSCLYAGAVMTLTSM